MIDSELSFNHLTHNEIKIILSVMLFLAIAIFAYLKQQSKVIPLAYRSFFNLTFFKQAIREDNSVNYKMGNLLLLQAFVVLSVCLYYFLGDILSIIYSIRKEIVFLLIFLLVVVWYSFNYIIRIVVSKISARPELSNKINLYNRVFVQTMGVFLLPGALGLYFFPHDIFGVNLQKIAELYVELVLILLLLNKLVQSLLQSFEIKISWFYIFLYLCTLEILPLCVGYQLLVN